MKMKVNQHAKPYVATAHIDDGPTDALDGNPSANSLSGVKPRTVVRRKGPPEASILEAARKRQASVLQCFQYQYQTVIQFT